MHAPWRRLAALSAIGCLVMGGAAIADPGEDHGHDGIPVPPPSLPATPPGIFKMAMIGQADKDGVVNSDLAFDGNLAYAGNYDGFRIIDISNPSNPQVLSDTKCRAVQSDLTVFRGTGGKRYLLQSIDRAVTTADCSATDTPLVQNYEDPQGNNRPADAGGPQPNEQVRNRADFGFEGLRLWDVTNPAAPVLLRFFQMACGSHTHTLVPDTSRGKVHAYVASYPLGSGITPAEDMQQAGDLACVAPHRKIGIVSMSLANPAAGVVKHHPLSADTEPYDPDGPAQNQDGKQSGNAPAFQACHDHQAFMPRRIVIGSCAGDAQYWKITNPAFPTSNVEGRHTHIKRENGTVESFDFIHNAVATWDGRIAAISDESGGGGEARCDGENSKRGFTFFYPLVEPGQPVNGFTSLRGKYLLDERPLGSEICVSHNGIVLPIKGRYRMVQAFYQGGTSYYDFTNPAEPNELAFADVDDAKGCTDAWSSYWYNNHVYVNGGLNRRVQGGPNGACRTNPAGVAADNRGFEAYRLFARGRDQVVTRKWTRLNPQTQEEIHVPR